MTNIEHLVPLLIGGTLSWFVIMGVLEIFKETSIAFKKRSHA